MGKVNN